MRHRKRSARESSPSCWSTTLCAVARSNRVELDVSTNRSQGLGAFDQKALKAIGPEHPVGTMTAVVPLGKTIFGLEGLRTADGSDWTSGRQNRGQVKSQGQWGVSARPLRLEALFAIGVRQPCCSSWMGNPSPNPNEFRCSQHYLRW
jgi:hypothetical protein